VGTLPNIFPILPGLLGLMRSVLPLPDGTPKTGAVEPPVPPLGTIGWFPYPRPPVRPWYPPIRGGTGGGSDRQQAPPFGPPPIYVMPPVWTGTPYRPPYDGIPLPPIPPDLWGREPWWFRGPVLRPDIDYIQPVPVPVARQPVEPGSQILQPEDMASIQPVHGSAPPPPPPPQPEPVKPMPPKRPTTWDYWDYQREGIQRD